MQINILVFDDAEELDFQGPWEVFGVVNSAQRWRKLPDLHKVSLVSREGSLITCAKGMQVICNASFKEAPKPDVLLVPGGQGTRKLLHDQETLDFIRAQADHAKWVTSVCTGSMLLTAAGLTSGKRLTTHWMAMKELEALCTDQTIVRDQRWVVDGNMVTAAGVSAGIDMAIWLLSQLHGDEVARMAVKGMEYDPAPPFPFKD